MMRMALGAASATAFYLYTPHRCCVAIAGTNLANPRGAANYIQSESADSPCCHTSTPSAPGCIWPRAACTGRLTAACFYSSRGMTRWQEATRPRFLARPIDRRRIRRSVRLHDQRTSAHDESDLFPPKALAAEGVQRALGQLFSFKYAHDYGLEGADGLNLSRGRAARADPRSARAADVHAAARAYSLDRVVHSVRHTVSSVMIASARILVHGVPPAWTARVRRALR